MADEGTRFAPLADPERQKIEREVAHAWNTKWPPGDSWIKGYAKDCQTLLGEIERLRRGLWDVAAGCGMDTDGNETPAHLAYPDIVELALREVERLRRDNALPIESPPDVPALLERADAAEAKAVVLEAALRRIATEPPDQGLTPNFRQFARDVLEAYDRG